MRIGSWRVGVPWQRVESDPTWMRAAINLWPPFAFAGIRLTRLSDDFRSARVELVDHPLTRNYVGTQFGGSIFSMTDPFWMVLVMKALGPDYVVWDKAAEVEFVSPGRSRLHADFHVTDEMLAELREAAAEGAKVLRWFETDVFGADGALVARVRKQLYVRRRRDRHARPAATVG